MEQTFLTELRIEKVRHLHDITIPLSKTERKHLILTGKNGCGKTSVLNELSEYIQLVYSGVHRSYEQYLEKAAECKLSAQNISNQSEKDRMIRLSMEYESMACELNNLRIVGCRGKWTTGDTVASKHKAGMYIVAYYGDNRKMGITPYKHIEKVTLRTAYGIDAKPSAELGRYLAGLKATQAFAPAKGDTARAAKIEEWFNRFENILRRIYGEPSLKLDFNIDTFQFSILIEGRDPFDFSTMSMGYAAVFDIVADLMMRMESKHTYDLEGIVLIDEIETHLHVELQRQIVPILTELFPNIQFILSTHSPFILNSAPNAVIYDLEKHMLVEDGMENLSYEGIVEGYFEVDRFSQKLRKYFEEYKQLVTSENLSDLDYARIAELEDYLDEVPDYLSLDFAHEYSRLKAEFDN